MEEFDYGMARPITVVALKYATTMPGGQYAMILGAPWRLKWSVSN